VLEKYHPTLLGENANIARLYERKKRFHLAKKYLKKALEIQRHNYGDEDERTKETAKKLETLEAKIR